MNLQKLIPAITIIIEREAAKSIDRGRQKYIDYFVNINRYESIREEVNLNLIDAGYEAVIVDVEG